MRFLNPKTDFAFKRIFGSETSRDILISFLNAVLGLKGADRIADVTILDPYQAPTIKGWKDSYVDVRAKDERGRSFIIEMQVLNHAGFEKRVLYNACKAYVGQIESGEQYRQLVDVIAITITDFVMFHDLTRIISSFRLRAAENPDITQRDLELVFVELPKFTLQEAELATTLDRWLFFLKQAGSLQAIPDALAADPPVGHALILANQASLTTKELEEQDRRLQWIGMQKGMMTDAEQARRDGKAEGLEEGKAEGIKEGIKDGMAETLTLLLEQRFGPVQQELVERIRLADSETLKRWTSRVLQAPTQDAVFSDR